MISTMVHSQNPGPPHIPEYVDPHLSGPQEGPLILTTCIRPQFCHHFVTVAFHYMRPNSIDGLLKEYFMIGDNWGL